MPRSSSSKAVEARRLRRKVTQLQSMLRNGAQDSHPAPTVSPLAPRDGFPDLPIVDGVRFASASAGVKYQGRDDVMLAEIAPGSSVAGVFTQSATRSAPVLWCQDALARFDPTSDLPIGILVNSGNANAFTGKLGTNAVGQTTKRAAKVLGTKPNRIFPASTGVIGEPLPADRISAVLATLQKDLSEDRAADAARAIMTTDTYAKGSGLAVDINGTAVSISGFAKGSGMIAPDMATMLVYIFTDAPVEQAVLQNIVATNTFGSFNAITVDSDTSTSDSLVVAATGRAKMPIIKSAKSKAAKAFAEALGFVMLDLAHQVVRDGEGATKFVEINVDGAVSDTSAKIIAKAIANSPLVKTAIAGEDPNWGRVVMAIGKSGEPADRDEISIRFGDILVAHKGWVAKSYTEAEGAAYMKNETIVMSTSLGVGRGKATVWTCDLTHQYITINADYRS